MKSLIVRLNHWIISFPKSVLLVSALGMVVGGYFTAKLYGNLKTDLAELLPKESRSVRDIDSVKSRLQAADDLSLLVFSDKPEKSRRFVEAFVALLKLNHKNDIAMVEYNISKELEFFRKRRTLYLEVADLKRVESYIREKIRYEQIIRDPLTIFSGISAIEPTLDFKGMERKYTGKVSQFARFPNGYYATPDQKIRVVLIYSKNAATAGKRLKPHELKSKVARTVEQVNPNAYDPLMKVAYSGGVQNTIEEQDALMADLALSTVLVMVIVGSLMVLYFGTFLSSFCVVISLLVGTAVTFGIAYLVVGNLNANSAFLGSIVMGNGINFPIILMSRYLEERRRGIAHEEASGQAMMHTASSTWTAAIAAGFAYGSLFLTSFRGFKQFGVIGFIGMMICWISAFTTLPALLSLFKNSPAFTKEPPKALPYFAAKCGHLVKTFPGSIVIATVVITAVSIFSFTRYDESILETNLKNLRNKVSIEKGSGFYGKFIDKIFQRYLTPVVVLAPSLESAQAIAKDLKSKQKLLPYGHLLANVQILEDFIPQDQDKKREILSSISRMLSSSIREKMGPKEQRLAAEFLAPESFQSFGLNDLPELVKSKFREQDGSYGKLVLVEPPLGSSTWRSDSLQKFVTMIRDSADQYGGSAPVAGALPLSSDMIASISRDGPRATLFAFLSVVVLVILQFPRSRFFMPVILALLLGVSWLFGFILIFWYKVNFLNFIALPITFGIGVDYAVNLFQRYHEEGSQNIEHIIRDTGGAVILCSITTIVGWGSLLIADNQAFVSFGTLAVIGEITCITAAIFSMPAILILWERRKP